MGSDTPTDGTNHVPIPCPSCGADILEGEDATVTEERADFTFQGKPATQDRPAKKCPECGEVIPI